MLTSQRCGLQRIPGLALHCHSDLLLSAKAGKVETTFPESLAVRSLDMADSALHELRKAKGVDSPFPAAAGAAGKAGYISAVAAFCAACVVLRPQQRPEAQLWRRQPQLQAPSHSHGADRASSHPRGPSFSLLQLFHQVCQGLYSTY